MTEPKSIWELEAWSPPGRPLDQDFGKLVLAPEMWREGISRDVFIGLSYVPDPIDCQNLKTDIREGVVSKKAFADFCNLNGLQCSMDDERSAASFLEFVNGRPLAWVHIPDDENANREATRINKLLEGKGFRLLNGFTGMQVTLANPLGQDDA